MKEINDIEKKQHDIMIATINARLEKGYLVNPQAIRKVINELDHRMDGIVEYATLFCINGLEEVHKCEEMIAKLRGEKKAYQEVLKEFNRRLALARKNG